MSDEKMESKPTDHATLADKRKSMMPPKPTTPAKGKKGVPSKPVLQYMPTYRLEPSFPLNREKCEKIMVSVMEVAFDNYVYDGRKVLNVCCEVSEEIKNRLKQQGYDRYRYVVTVTVGEKLMQGYKQYINFLWDATKDGFLRYIVDQPEYFAIVTVFYLYYD